MSPTAFFFLLAVLVTAAVALLLVKKMSNQLHQAAPTARRASVFLHLPSIVRQHDRAFPQSGPMLAFWLSVIFLLVWVTCVVFSLATHL